MNDPTSPTGKGDLPGFPPPRKRETPSPFRKAAPAVPDVPPPVKLVTRPDPSNGAGRPEPRSSSSTPLADDPSDWRAAGRRLVARFPRLSGAFLASIGLFCLQTSVVDDRQAVRVALAAGKSQVYVTKPGYLVLYAAFAGVGLWMLVAGMPTDDETGQPKGWWYLGIAVSALVAIGLREPLATWLVQLFA